MIDSSKRALDVATRSVPPSLSILRADNPKSSPMDSIEFHCPHGLFIYCHNRKCDPLSVRQNCKATRRTLFDQQSSRPLSRVPRSGMHRLLVGWVRVVVCSWAGRVYDGRNINSEAALAARPNQQQPTVMNARVLCALDYLNCSLAQSSEYLLITRLQCPLDLSQGTTW